MTSKEQNAKQAGKKMPGYRVVSPASQELDRMAVQEIPLSLSVQRAIRDLPAASVGDVRALQSTYGNRAVLGLLRGTSASRPVIQAKLRVGPANDSYEREADHTADRVMNMSIVEAAPVQRMGPEDDDDLPEVGVLAERIQRYQDEVILQTKPLASSVTSIVQAQAGDGFEVGSSVESRLAASKGAGTPLPAQTRDFMQPRFGADFSGVRVHTGSGAAQMNRELSAQAFTHGADIYMGQGKYDPGSSAGKWLLAHELTHVVQQTGMNRSKLASGQSGDRHKWEAGQAEKRVAQSLSSPALQRRAVNPRGRPRQDNNAADNDCLPDDVTPASLTWDVVADGADWRADVTALTLTGQINVSPWPSKPDEKVVPNTPNPVKGGNIINSPGSKNHWEFVIEDLADYNDADGGAGEFWHSTLASKTHEWTHWNKDWMEDCLGTDGGDWAQTNTDLDALQVPQAAHADAAAARTALEPQVGNRLGQFDGDATDRWNALPDDPGAAPPNRGYVAGMRVLNRSIGEIREFAKRKGW